MLSRGASFSTEAGGQGGKTHTYVFRSCQVDWIIRHTARSGVSGQVFLFDVHSTYCMQHHKCFNDSSGSNVKSNN